MEIITIILGFTTLLITGYKLGKFTIDRNRKKRLMRDIIHNSKPSRKISELELDVLLPTILAKNITYFHQEKLQSENVYSISGACMENSITTIIHGNRSDQSYYSINGIEVYFPYTLKDYLEPYNDMEVVFTKKCAYPISINGVSIIESEKNDPKSLMLTMQWFREKLANTVYYQEPHDIEVIRKRKIEKNELNYCFQWTGTLSFLGISISSILAYYYYKGNLPEYVAYIIFASMACSFLFLIQFQRPKSFVNVVKVPYLNIKGEKMYLGETGFKIKYPEHWQGHMKLDQPQTIEVSENKQLLRIGHLSMNQEIGRFGMIRRGRSNFILLALSGLCLMIAIFSTYTISHQIETSLRYIKQVTHPESIFLIVFVYLIAMIFYQFVILVCKSLNNDRIEKALGDEQ